MQNKKLRELLMNENGFAFDQSTGYTYNINTVGVEIIDWIKTGCDEEALVQHITAAYDVDAATARRDLDTFLNALLRYGLIPRQEEVSA